MRVYQKKIKLGKKNRQTKWAPVWAVVKKNGAKKRKHPSSMTPYRRHWRRTKLKITPRKVSGRHLG